MIFADALPKIKTFLRPARLAASTCAQLARFVAASLCHPGRMSCSQAAGAIRSQARHRAQLARFLARDRRAKDWAVLTAVADLLLAQEARRGGTWLFVPDQTHVGQQGQHAANTVCHGSYRRRPRRSGREQKKHARRSCHCFVCGLLISPSGLRIPSCRCYYTRDYCQAKGLSYHKQPAPAAALIRQVAVPAGAAVVVLGDTAFEAEAIRGACAARGFCWVVPVNPERVPAGGRPRPGVRSLGDDLSAEHFEAVRLVPGRGACAAHGRAARCRVGPKAKARTFWVHPERRAAHDVGGVLLVFSTKEQPQAGQKVRVQKVLMTDGVHRPAAEVVAPYAVRWQVDIPHAHYTSSERWCGVPDPGYNPCIGVA
jgi:hypothetical protein